MSNWTNTFIFLPSAFSSLSLYLFLPHIMCCPPNIDPLSSFVNDHFVNYFFLSYYPPWFASGLLLFRQTHIPNDTSPPSSHPHIQQEEKKPPPLLPKKPSGGVSVGGVEGVSTGGGGAGGGGVLVVTRGGRALPLREKSLDLGDRQRQEARRRLLQAKRAASFRQNSATESADSIEIYIPEAQTRLWASSDTTPRHWPQRPPPDPNLWTTGYSDTLPLWHF